MIKKSLGIALLSASSLFAAESPWSQSFSLGLNISKGNTDSTAISADYDGLRKYSKAELQLAAKANFGEEDSNNVSTKTNDNYYGEVNFRRNLGKHYYWLINSSYTVDNIAQLDHRITVGPGLGYRLINKKMTSMDLEAGLAYFAQKYDNTPKDDSLAYRLAEKWSHKLSTKAKLWQSAEIVGDTDEGDNYVLKGEIGVRTTLSGSLSLKSTVSDTYTNDPALGKKKNDISIMTKLVYSF